MTNRQTEWENVTFSNLKLFPYDQALDWPIVLCSLLTVVLQKYIPVPLVIKKTKTNAPLMTPSTLYIAFGLQKSDNETKEITKLWQRTALCQVGCRALGVGEQAQNVFFSNSGKSY